MHELINFVETSRAMPATEVDRSTYQTYSMTQNSINYSSACEHTPRRFCSATPEWFNSAFQWSWREGRIFFSVTTVGEVARPCCWWRSAAFSWSLVDKRKRTQLVEGQTDDNEHASLTSECRALAAETKFAFILSILIVVSHVNDSRLITRKFLKTSQGFVTVTRPCVTKLTSWFLGNWHVLIRVRGCQ